MRVRMKVDISGTLDGEPYPRNGEVGELSDTVAEKLLASGQAVKAGAPYDDAEREAQALVEERPAPQADVETTTTVKRGPGRPRKNS